MLDCILNWVYDVCLTREPVGRDTRWVPPILFSVYLPEGFRRTDVFWEGGGVEETTRGGP